MIYNTEIGKIYDCIYFGIEYFNKHEVEASINGYFPDTQFMFDCFEEIRAQFSYLPPILEPFFFSEDEIASPISSYFAKHIDFETSTIDSFVMHIKHHSQTLYERTVESVFHSVKLADTDISPTTSPADYIDCINKLDLSTEFKLQVSLLFSNFEYGVELLADTLKEIYIHINALHQKYSKAISQEYSNIICNNKANRYHQLTKFNDEVNVESASISLLNHYVVFSHKKANQVWLLLGLRHEDALSENPSEKETSADTFMTTCGNEMRMAVIHALLEHGELTNSQLSKIIGCPVTTLIKHIEVMRSHNVLTIARRSGLQIFYRLNAAYFKQCKVSMDRLFYEIMKQCEK